jgi:hypothetical protein
MTPQSSALTPLGFTREYQAYRAANLAVPFADSRLLAAARFWLRFPDALSSDSYSSFWLEDLPPLFATAHTSLEDLHPDELVEIAEFLGTIDSKQIPITLPVADTWEAAARKWLYVGDIARALKCLAAANMHVPDLSSGLTESASDAQSLPSALTGALGSDFEPLKRWLAQFDAEWRATRESGVTNQATCILVERDAAGRPLRGRLRTLEAHIEQLPRDRTADEVVFGHQLCSADDPQVRGAYSALASMRGSINPQTAIRNAQSHFRARFTFTNGGGEPYGGDSLAFASFAAAYGDLWAKDLHRERRLVSAQIALTGALADNGAAEQVHPATLAKKVERVFFSPLSYLAVPKGNRAEAEAEVERLQSQFPRRRLRILPIELASDLVTDGNITIPERVCFGEYAVRAATKYSRSMKVQVPILILLIFIAGWIGLPALRAVLDRNPVDIEHTQKGFYALNKYGHRIWEQSYSVEAVVNEPPYKIFDLDGDGANEILYFVGTPTQTPDNAKIDVFNADHALRFRLDPVILGQYPGDYTPTEPYMSGMINVVVAGGQPVIVTGANAHNPSRFHIKLWSIAGDSLGWYVNAGVTTAPIALDTDLDGTDELIFGGYNIRVRSCALFALRLRGSYGVAPPYRDEQYDLSKVTPGNQLHYMVFPKTDITEVMADRLYNSLAGDGIYDVTSSGFRFDVLEGADQKTSREERSWVVNYYIDSTLRLGRVDVDDSYKARREALVRADSLPEVPWPAYFRNLQDTVMYWMDGAWVTEKRLRHPESP